MQLSYLGLRGLNGEQMRAYAVSMEGGLPLEVKNTESAKWNLTLYFTGTPERLRAAQAKSDSSEVRITVNDVRREKVPASRFELPAGYYALEPLTLSEKAPEATKRYD